MENTHVDPYAPPKSTLTQTNNTTNNTTYLEHDGYTFQNELVANHHFKSPLICAKLGISIPPESNPQPKSITVKRIPKAPSFIPPLVTLVSFLLVVVYIAYMRVLNPMPIIVLYFIIAYIIKRLTTKPYTIPFYFSEKYTYNRSLWVKTLTIILLILTTFFIIGVRTEKLEYIQVTPPLAIIALMILKFKTAYFVVTQTKGEFHYIRGVHQGLLDALPHLPLHSQNPNA